MINIDLSHMFEEEDGGGRSSHNAPAEKHLQSPITSSLLERVINIINLALELKPKLPSYGHARCIPQDPGYLVRQVFRLNPTVGYSGLEHIVTPIFENIPFLATAPSILEPADYPERFSRKMKVDLNIEDVYKEARALYNEELKAYASWADVSNVKDMIQEEISSRTSISKDALDAYAQYRYWDFVTEAYRARKKNKNYGGPPVRIGTTSFFTYNGFLMEQTGLPAVTTKDGVVVARLAPKRKLMTYEQLQMLQDACLARFNTFLALDLGVANGPRSVKRFLSSIIRWQEDVLVKYNNAGYELVKGPESLTKTYLTTMSNGDLLPSSSFVRTAEKMRQKERKISKSPYTPLTDRLVVILLSIDDMDTVVELFGCTKLSGHPTVYAEHSADSVKKEALPTGSIHVTAVREMHWHFMHLVLQRYVLKHKIWPPFAEKQSPAEGTELHKMWQNGSTHILPSMYKLSEWEGVEYGKFMEFDYSPDYLDMIDDKSICPGAQHAAAFWHGNDKGKRRLLDELISRKDVDTRAIVDRMRQNRFSPDERIVELTQKEREFKTAARCFAKLTFEVRLFFVLTEANLKRFMGGDTGDNGYVPQQTMTMSNSRLRERLYALTKNRARSNTCLMEVDFSRWNLRWRACTINPIARTLESIFGLPGVFSRAHYFFSSSTIVLTDKHSLPRGVTKGLHASKWPESELVWRGHKGGFEGIQQTLWTIGTIAMMYYALQDEEVTFQMAGQGDNLVAYLSFQGKREQTSYYLRRLLLALDRRCSYLNHEVKPEECIDSKTVLTYGKEIYVDGVHKLYSLKFSSRAFARVDYTAPSLSKEIASIVSNSVAVAGNLYQTHKAILWKFIQVLLFFRRRLSSRVYKIEHAGIERILKSERSRQVLLIPGSLGGLPMMPWTRYFSRGETDDLSFDVAATYHLSKSCDIVKSYTSLLAKGEFSPDNPDLTNLITDPHSIPIEIPHDATKLISNAVSEQLPLLVKNADIAKLVSPTLVSQGHAFKTSLSKLRPLYPAIMNDIYMLTPAGLRERTVKRFSMTRTIEKLIPGLDFSERILRAGAHIVNVLMDRVVLASKTVGQAHLPPFQMCSKLRTLWKADLDNALVGIYTPFEFPLDSFSPKVQSISATIQPRSELHLSCGNAPPNFGTVTRQKVAQHGYRIVNCSSTMRDLKQAALIFSELDGHKDVEPLIDSIIRARSPWKLSQVAPIFPSVYGGTAVHRHAASRHHFGVIGSCSVPTHVTYSSDRSGVLTGGENDYPVVFQTMFLSLANIFQNLSYSNHLGKLTSLCLNVPSNLCTIQEDPPSNLGTIPNIIWPDLRGNKLAYVAEMYASEVSEIPSPDLVPHLSGEPSDCDLVYSYIDSVVLEKTEGKKVWDGVTDPYDMFDFSEISRVSPYDVEKALEWAVAGDVFYDLLCSGTEVDFGVKLKSSLRLKSTIMAGMWVRIRLHSMFHDSQYNVARHISLDPGSSGFKRSVDHMAGVFRKHIQETLEARDSSIIPTRLLFHNWKTEASHVARKRLVLSHVIATYPDCNAKELLESVKSTQPPKELLQRDPAAYLFTVCKERSRRISRTTYMLPNLPVKYINTDAAMCMRALRKRPKTLPRHISELPLLRVMHQGTVKWKLSDESGIMYPPSEEESHIPHYDRMRVLTRRRLGKVSPLYSDWTCVLRHIKYRFPRATTEIHSMGVGRGAVARASAELGYRVIGYDLNESFPVVSHRSSSYIPPEVAQSGLTHSFMWSNHTYDTDGNLLDGDIDFNTSENAVAVIDLDVTLDLLITILRRIDPATYVVIRFRGTHDEMRYLVDLLQPERVSSLLSVEGELRDCVFEVPVMPQIGFANYQRVEFTKCPEIEYTTEPVELLDQLINVDSSLSRVLGINSDNSLRQVRQFFNYLVYTADRIPQEHEDAQKLARGLNTTRPIGKHMRILAVVQNILSSVD